MSTCKEFEDALRLSLAAEFGVDVSVGGNGTNVESALIPILLPLVIDLGGGLLMDCLGNDSDIGGVISTILDAIRSRLIVNKAMRTSAIPREHRAKCRDALLKTVAKMGREKMEAVAAELKAPKIDWSAW